MRQLSIWDKPNILKLCTKVQDRQCRSDTAKCDLSPPLSLTHFGIGTVGLKASSASSMQASRPDSPRAAALTPLAQLPLLGGVSVIISRACPAVASLSHVLLLLSDFHDYSVHWSFNRACETGCSTTLLRRIHAREQLEGPMDPFYRDWQASRVMTVAAARGKLETVKWLATEYAPGMVVTDGVESAAENGHLDVLKWFHDEYGHAMFGMHEMWLTAKNGHLEVLKWLHDHSTPSPVLSGVAVGYGRSDPVFGCRTPASKSLITAAASEGQLHVVQWLANVIGKWMRQQETRRRNTSEDEVRVMETRAILANALAEAVGDIPDKSTNVYECDIADTAANGHLDVLEWLHAAPFPWLKLIRMRCLIWKPTCNGHFDVVKWIYNTCEDVAELGDRSMDAAAASGHMDILSWMHETGRFNWSVEALFWAAERGHLDVVRWLFDHGYSRINAHAVTMLDTAMMNAAFAGDLDVLKLLHAHRPGVIDATYIMDLAAMGGHLEVVQWLHTHRSEGCTTSAMDHAAARGKLDVVKWLHEHRSEGCTAGAMDGAAAGGHLDAVLWLHANRTEGCTVDAMNRAAASGHLDVVRWLHANRTEGCTTEAMDSAAANGHMHTVRWLHAHGAEGCTTLAMDGAAKNGHFDVLLFLREHCTEGCSNAAFVNAYNSSQLDILRWLAHNYPDQFDPDGVQRRGERHEAKIYMDAWLRHGHL